MIKSFFKPALAFVKKEVVLCISLLLALCSVFFVPVDAGYLGYIDFHTLAILLGLMVVMAGLQSLGVFAIVGRWMLKKAGNARSLTVVLVLLCFVFSMAITNDVALITFVPFAIEVLTMAGLEAYLIKVIVLQTIASNLGSMLTPIGNPQNLYLFSIGDMSLGSFIALMLPYTLLSLAGLLAACAVLVDKRPAQMKLEPQQALTASDKKKAAGYLLLFLFAMTGVAHLVKDYIVLGAILIAGLLMDRKTLIKPDYSLLLTFLFLFIFIGNMKRIPGVNALMNSLIRGNEIVTSVLSSQVISNVPAAILLSGFTDNIPALIVGTNLGGLGTIIASMASLISFKYYSATPKKSNAAYLGLFTLMNVIFLAALLLLHWFIG